MNAQEQERDLELVRVRAYEIWEREGRPEGRDLEHWREAEHDMEVEFRIGFPDALNSDNP